jgi:hypothetical protein
MKGATNKIQPILRTLCTGLIFHLMDLSEAAKKGKQKIAIGSIFLLLQNFIAVNI